MVTMTSELRTLAALALTAEQTAQATTAQVIRAKDAGATWDEIGDALGVSKQSAWERYVADWNDYLRQEEKAAVGE